MSLLLITTVFKVKIRSSVALDAIFFEVILYINERNNRHVCTKQKKSAMFENVSNNNGQIIAKNRGQQQQQQRTAVRNSSKDQQQ